MTDAEQTPLPSDAAGPRRVCEDVQDLLTDFLARELGPARLDFVREHLRNCPDCLRAAQDMEGALALLRRAANTAAPAALDDERRRRLDWAVLHPALDWMSRHHRLVSAIAVVVAIVLALLLARLVRVERHLRREWRSPEIWYGRLQPAPSTNGPGPDAGSRP
jgi:predicted anti-sigma-YlaC factor YlaD